VVTSLRRPDGARAAPRPVGKHRGRAACEHGGRRGGRAGAVSANLPWSAGGLGACAGRGGCRRRARPLRSPFVFATSSHLGEGRSLQATATFPARYSGGPGSRWGKKRGSTWRPRPGLRPVPNAGFSRAQGRKTLKKTWAPDRPVPGLGPAGNGRPSAHARELPVSNGSLESPRFSTRSFAPGGPACFLFIAGHSPVFIEAVRRRPLRNPHPARSARRREPSNCAPSKPWPGPKTGPESSSKVYTRPLARPRTRKAPGGDSRSHHGPGHPGPGRLHLALDAPLRPTNTEPPQKLPPPAEAVPQARCPWHDAHRPPRPSPPAPAIPRPTPTRALRRRRPPVLQPAARTCRPRLGDRARQPCRAPRNVVSCR